MFKGKTFDVYFIPIFFNIFKMEYIRNRITEGNYKTTVIKPDL